MDLTNPTFIKQLLTENGLNTKRFLGQNFLIDQRALHTIVQAADLSTSEHVVEVGPGLGVLTQELLKSGSQVTAIELDKGLYELLTKNFASYKNLTAIHQDALRWEPPSTPYKVVANIPYNITSPLIRHFLHALHPPTSITLLIQKEVAEKICVLEPKMTVLSLQVALFADAKIIKKVPAGCFLPAPKVDSAIIHFTPHGRIPQEDAMKILKLAKRAFLNRRKKLSNTLPELKNTNTKIDLNRRPETLTIDEWQQLIAP